MRTRKYELDVNRNTRWNDAETESLLDIRCSKDIHDKFEKKGRQGHKMKLWQEVRLLQGGMSVSGVGC